MKIYSKEEYAQAVKYQSPHSPIFKNCFYSFIVGGGICSFGQFLLNIYMKFGFSLNDGKTAVSVTLILLAAILTALGIYDKIAKFAGAGTLVPITGFANSMVSPAMEFKSEGLVTGLGVKLFIVSGPVLVFGVSASVIYGLVLIAIQWFGGNI